MNTIKIKKGRNIPLRGQASAELRTLPFPSEAILPFFEFDPRQVRLLLKEGDPVQVGTAVAEDRTNSKIIFVSPVSGAVREVRRGEKRALISVVISADGRQTTVEHSKISLNAIADLSREAVIERLMAGGLWPFLRQRPFSRVAKPNLIPKSIFVRAMNTDPLAAQVDVLLGSAKEEFQAGLDILRRLTSGKVFLCCDANTTSPVLTQAQNVELVGFSGPHPAGNVGTHIHSLDPIGKGSVVWHIEAEDVLRVARLFLNGRFDPSKVIAVTGEGASTRTHVKTIIGAPVSLLLGEPKKEGCRYLSGSVLSGIDVGYEGSVGVFHSQLTVLPAGGQRKFLGWAGPRFGEYTFTRMIGGGLLPSKDCSLDTDINGSERAIVLNDVYDDLNAVDVLPYFLIKAIHVGEIEEMVRLGILECAPEDFALCSFACPSKVDIGGVIQRGLDMMEKEG